MSLINWLTMIYDLLRCKDIILLQQFVAMHKDDKPVAR